MPSHWTPESSGAEEDDMVEEDDYDGPADPREEEYAEFMRKWAERMESTARPDGLEVDVRRGSEGPAHDPYAYTRISVNMPDGRKVVLHTGLGVWLRVDDVEVELPWSADRDDRLISSFEETVGFELDQLEWWADAPYRGVPCMACGQEGCRGTCCE